MKPLWHAWACVSGLSRALAGCVWAAMGAAQETETVLPMAVFSSEQSCVV